MVRIDNASLKQRRQQRSWLSLPFMLIVFFLGCAFVLSVISSIFLPVGDPFVTANDNVPVSGAIQQLAAPYLRKSPIVVGYAVSVTGCGSDPITEGAAVLKHSIHLASVHNEDGSGGRYSYQMYAIVHPTAESCALPLADVGYKILKRDTPVAVADIKGQFLREHVEKNGCCGEKELIKLEAFKLVDHPIVVHMDLDTLILKPLDPLFDLMLEESGKSDASKIEIMWKDKPIPSRTDAMFTLDYSMVLRETKFKPVQGGFLVLRPDLDVYKEVLDIIREGDFREGGGWGGQVGPFHGAMTFQGLIPYYFNYLHPGRALELNRCIYNQMVENPRNQRTVNDIVHGDCLDGQDDCEDCRSRPVSDVATAHFTLCQKPWLCLAQDEDIIQQRLCRKLHHEWYRIRSQLEQSLGHSAVGNGDYQKDHFFGYCTKPGKEGYLPIQLPKA